MMGRQGKVVNGLGWFWGFLFRKMHFGAASGARGINDVMMQGMEGRGGVQTTSCM
jgi:hypothetical protein